MSRAASGGSRCRWPALPRAALNRIQKCGTASEQRKCFALNRKSRSGAGAHLSEQRKCSSVHKRRAAHASSRSSGLGAPRRGSVYNASCKTHLVYNASLQEPCHYVLPVAEMPLALLPAGGAAPLALLAADALAAAPRRLFAVDTSGAASASLARRFPIACGQMYSTVQCNYKM